MARSSFDYFRKHTKVAVVALGALCMLAFVVADPLMQYLNEVQAGGSSSRRGEVAVSWKGGQLTEGQLSDLVYKRNILAGFLRAVEQEGQYMAIQAGVPANVPPRVQPLNLATDPSQGVEQDVLQISLFSDAAKKAGMAVSDATIRDYLSALGRDYVSRKRMRELISSISLGNGRATPEFMFDLLRNEMLARDYIGSYMFSRATVLPQQRWQDWLKVNDRVVVEAAALDVDDFVSEVEEPTDQQVQQYYEEYKDTPPGMVQVQNTLLPSPTPGFRVPGRARVQYVKADFAAAVEEAKPEITDEQIEAFYEENQEMFVEQDLGLMPDEGDIQAADEAPDAGADEAAQDEASESDDAPSTEARDPSAEQDQDDASTDGDQPEDAAQPADSTEADGENDSEQGSTGPEQGSTGQTDAADAGGDTPPGEQAEPTPDEAQSGGLIGGTPFRLTAFQNNDETDASEEPQEQDSSAEGDSAGDNQPGEGPADAASTPLDDFLSGPDAEAPQSGAEESSDDEQEVRYQPLDEVRDIIVDRLAEQQAMAKLAERLNDLRGLLKRDYNAYFTERIDAEAEDKEAPEPPQALSDWEKLASENGLEHGQTELLTYLELRDTETGKLYQPDNQERQVPLQVAQQVFRTDGLELFEPAIAFDMDKNQYLVQVTEKQQAYTPKLEEIRQEVVDAWKREQAAELALKRAEQLASEAQESGKSLDEKFADQEAIEVVESDRFGWYEPFTVNQYGMQALRLGRPGAVEAAGPDFMETVFSLGPNEVGATLNHDKSAAYVLRIAMRESSQEELRQNFLRDWNDARLRYALDQQYMAESSRAVLYALTGGEAPDWKRDPDSDPRDDA